jgi:PAS domain S-box-containing protein
MCSVRTERTQERQQRRLAILLTLALVCVGLGVMNLLRQQAFQLPGDGVFWTDTPSGVQARFVELEGPAARAGLRVGDVLRSINAGSVGSAEQAARRVFDIGIGGHAAYQVFRSGTPLNFDILVEAQPRPVTVRAFLQFVGALYLLLGLFVVWRRSEAARATHFYLYCLASFVLFTFSYTGELDTPDWVIYWSSVAAMLLQPALFAHFCLSYPAWENRAERAGLTRRRLLVAIYGSAMLLAAFHVAVALGFLRFAAPLSELRWLLDRLAMGYLVLMYLTGIVLLASAHRRASTRLVSKQIAWVFGSALCALGPFAVAYGIPYFLGHLPNAWMNLSALSLVLLPLGMAYSIVRHRLLDVEIALGRGFAYTLATGALVGLYLGVAALGGGFFREYFPAAGTVGLVVAVIATGLLFQPLQRWIQGRVDRYFLRRRYDYREALLRFGRELSTQTDLNKMISSLLARLAETLEVRRAAIFVPGDPESGSYVLRGAVGLGETNGSETTWDLAYLGCLESGNAPLTTKKRDRLFFPGWEQEIEQELGASKPSWQETIRELQLSYYFPCLAQNRLAAVLALGKTQGGELLSEEDAALVETLAGYVAAAIDNVRLFESLAAKAKQFEDLQQFSENILESINVGLLAVDLDDRVQSVNTPLELMYPLPFRQCRGKKLEEIFPADLMAEFVRSRDDAGIHTIYRRRVRLEGGQEKVLNIAVAPLLSKNCDWIGRLIIFDDVTDRVALEAQLVQAEKLSSVGLLAAGVAHEVNTPLTVISTQAQMLAKQMPPSDRNFKVVEKIIRQTFRASEIINSLLNFSRTKGASFSAVEMNKIISETLLLLDHQLKTSRIEVETHLEPGLPFVHGNSDKLQQVFLNLFLNAKDAMPEGGQLRVTSWTEDSRVRIEIRDNGVGIPPEHLRRIYDPFFTTKGPGRGTGLGLAVSYGIIHEHSGKISAESRPSLGTRFDLEFPVLRKPVHA